MAASVGNMTVQAATDGLRSGAFSSVELTRALLDAITARNGGLNAYLWVDAEDALRQAQAADVRRAAGGDGALLGVPLAIKDVLSVDGQPCGCDN